MRLLLLHDDNERESPTCRALWWDGRLVGTLHTNPHGEMQFVCDAAWLRDEDAPPLSLSLPKRDAPFKRRERRPFFAGLLPDSVHAEAEHERVFEPARRNRTVALEVLAGLEPVSKVNAGAGLRHVVETPKPE